MATIGFVVHSHREAALLLAKETAEWLAEHGHRAEIMQTSADPDHLEAPPGLDLAVSLGGDGTMLRTVDLVCHEDVPVLGVNLGHLGYLTVIEPSGLRNALSRFLAGDYIVEPRMTLDVTVGPPPAAPDDETAVPGGRSAPDGAEPVTAGDSEGRQSPGALRPVRVRRNALNDVVLQRTHAGHTMHTEVAVNGTPFLNFACDSLILATPTGSTAYNLSARGPIVSPRARVQVLTPVAPHMLFDRSLVLDADEEVSITAGGEQPVDVVVDGWHTATLVPGQAVSCRRGDHDALLVTFGARDFHRILKSKFNLADR